MGITALLLLAGAATSKPDPWGPFRHLIPKPDRRPGLLPV